MNSVLKLEDLNTDVLLEIFYKSEFWDLLNLADTNCRFRALIARHIMIPKYRFHENLIEINPNKYPDKAFQFDNKYNTMRIYGPALTSKILRIFGSIVSRIGMSHLGVEWNRKFSLMINEYCTESLHELEIFGTKLDESIFLEWKKPFKNARKVTFGLNTWNCENTSMNLREMFPSIRRLKMVSRAHSSSKCIDHHFKNLEHIEFPMYTREYYVGAKKKMYENIFKNVKRFYISLDREAPKYIPFEFHQLEEIQLYDGSSLASEAGEWIEFLGKQLKLKTLIIDAELSLRHLQELTVIIEKIPKLEEIRIKWIQNVGNDVVLIARIIDEIARIIRTNRKLKKIVLFHMSEGVCNKLRRITHLQWKYEKEGYRSVRRWLSLDACTIVLHTQGKNV